MLLPNGSIATRRTWKLSSFSRRRSFSIGTRMTVTARSGLDRALRGLLPETLDVGDLLLALILLLLYLDSEDEDPKSLLIILAVCFFL